MVGNTSPTLHAHQTSPNKQHRKIFDMPAKDIIHDAVKNALIKDGWTITHFSIYSQI